MSKKFQGILTAGVLVAAAALPATSRADLVFDNMTSFLNDEGGAVSAAASTPNTFMGAGYQLAAGTTSITGFDLFPVNTSGTGYVALRMTVYVWDNVNMGTVNASNPAFSGLLGVYTATSSVDDFPTGSFFTFNGVNLVTPLALSDTTIGLTFNMQASSDGVTFSNVNKVSTLISHSTAPTVGSAIFNGYYRNANNETNGNFTSGLRLLSGVTDQSLAVRIYGAVPEPGTYLMFGLGLAALLVARRRTAA